MRIRVKDNERLDKSLKNIKNDFDQPGSTGMTNRPSYDNFEKDTQFYKNYVVDNEIMIIGGDQGHNYNSEIKIFKNNGIQFNRILPDNNSQNTQDYNYFTYGYPFVQGWGNMGVYKQGTLVMVIAKTKQSTIDNNYDQVFKSVFGGADTKIHIDGNTVDYGQNRLVFFFKFNDDFTRVIYKTYSGVFYEASSNVNQILNGGYLYIQKNCIFGTRSWSNNFEMYIVEFKDRLDNGVFSLEFNYREFASHQNKIETGSHKFVTTISLTSKYLVIIVQPNTYTFYTNEYLSDTQFNGAGGAMALTYNGSESIHIFEIARVNDFISSFTRVNNAVGNAKLPSDSLRNYKTNNGKDLGMFFSIDSSSSCHLLFNTSAPHSIIPITVNDDADTIVLSVAREFISRFSYIHPGGGDFIDNTDEDSMLSKGRDGENIIAIILKRVWDDDNVGSYWSEQFIYDVNIYQDTIGRHSVTFPKTSTTNYDVQFPEMNFESGDQIPFDFYSCTLNDYNISNSNFYKNINGNGQEIKAIRHYDETKRSNLGNQPIEFSQINNHHYGRSSNTVYPLFYKSVRNYGTIFNRHHTQLTSITSGPREGSSVFFRIEETEKDGSIEYIPKVYFMIYPYPSKEFIKPGEGFSENVIINNYNFNNENPIIDGLSSQITCIKNDNYSEDGETGWVTMMVCYQWDNETKEWKLDDSSHINITKVLGNNYYTQPVVQKGNQSPFNFKNGDLGFYAIHPSESNTKSMYVNITGFTVSETENKFKEKFNTTLSLDTIFKSLTIVNDNEPISIIPDLKPTLTDSKKEKAKKREALVNLIFDYNGLKPDFKVSAEDIGISGAELGGKSNIKVIKATGDETVVNVSNSADANSGWYTIVETGKSLKIEGQFGNAFSVTKEAGSSVINHTYNITGGSGFVLNGDSRPNIKLVKGGVYVFNHNAGGSHPFIINTVKRNEIHSASNAHEWLRVNHTESKTLDLSSLNLEETDTLYYWCLNHSNWGGEIDVLDGYYKISSTGKMIVTESSGQDKESRLQNGTYTNFKNTLNHYLLEGDSVTVNMEPLTFGSVYSHGSDVSGAGAGGDPYVTTLDGVFYKLDNIDGYCRMLQGVLDGKNIIINVEMTKDSKIIESDMNKWSSSIDRFRDFTENGKADQHEQSFFTKVYIKYGNSEYLYDIINNTVLLDIGNEIVKDSDKTDRNCVLPMYENDLMENVVNLYLGSVCIRITKYYNKQLRSTVDIIGGKQVQYGYGFAASPMDTNICRIDDIKEEGLIERQPMPKFKYMSREIFETRSKQNQKRQMRILVNCY